MKLEPGRILEIETPKGKAYVQYVSRDPEHGDTIRVLPGLFATQPQDLAQLAREPGYFTFYPAGVAVAQKLAAAVATLPIPPGLERPKRMRKHGAVAGGRVLTWRLMDEDGRETVRQKLSPEEKRLPIAAIWNHEALVYHLVEEWTPETDRGTNDLPPVNTEPRERRELSNEEAIALAAKMAAAAQQETSPPGTLLKVSHYLYFPSLELANAAARELRGRRLEVTLQKSAHDDNLLVLVKERTAPEAVGDLEDFLAGVAEAHSGEYDGRETAVAAAAESAGSGGPAR